MVLLRALALLGLSVLLLSWAAEARGGGHSLRRLPPPSPGGDEGPRPRHRRHRHPPHHLAAAESGEYEAGSEEPSLEEDRLAPRQVLLDRLRVRGRETAHQQHPAHRRRSGKLRPLSSESSALGLDPLPGGDASGERELVDALWKHVRGKRHNRRRTWTAEDLKSFNDSRLKLAQFESESAYEVEVREAQNSSLCNYTVIPIPDPGGRIPRELEHIKCNHAGSRCQDKGTYCCIQTYRNVEVMYVSGKKELMKVYSGCVCALQSYGTLEPYAPDVNIND